MANKLLEEVKNFVKKYSLWIALALLGCCLAWAIFDKIGDSIRDSDFKRTVNEMRDGDREVRKTLEVYKRERQEFYRQFGEGLGSAKGSIRDALETVGRLEKAALKVRD